MGASKRTDEYRRREQVLWTRYGLEPRERTITVGPQQTKLRVTEVGDGPPIVLFGGTGGTGPYWAPLLARLEARAVVVDRPGFGLSEPLDNRRQPQSALIAAIVEDVLDQTGVTDAAAVIGASIGDVWALTAAERLADRVRTVVLLGGGPLTEAITPPPFIRLLRTPLGALIVGIPQRPKMLRGQLRGMGHAASLDAGRIPQEFFDWQSALMRKTPSMRNERRMVQAVLQRDGFVPDIRFESQRRAAVKQPVLMVLGSRDPVGSVEIWSSFMDDLPDGQLRVLDDAGHLPWWDEPDTVAGWVREHLAGGR